MKRILAALLALPLALASVLVLAAPAQADDRRCRGTIYARYIDGNVIVPAGATCYLKGTRVDGNVEVRRGARLFARGIRVNGNVQAKYAKRVEIKLRGDGSRSRIGGDIQLENGRNGGLVKRAVVGGDIQLFGNRGGATFWVKGNIVDGNLQCKNNSPRPKGYNNRVDGNKEGQCRGF